MYFALGMMSVTLWTLAVALGYAAVPLHLKVLFAKIDAVGYNSALALFVLFALYYAGLDEWGNKRWIRSLLVLIPLSNIVLISTNELHGLIWIGFLPVGNNVVVFEHGSGFIWVQITGYLMIITMIASVWLSSRKGSELSRRQGRLIIFASIFPLAANIIYLFKIQGVEGVDWTSITFSITGLLSLRALYGQRLLDLAPIAREKLVSSLSDGMIVVDAKNRIIDINPAAESILEQTTTSLTGKRLQEVMPLTYSQMMEAPQQSIQTEFETSHGDKQYFDVLISPLYEKGKTEQIGNLIVFREITERKKNELRLLQLTQAVEQSPTSVIITDTNGIITFVNPFFTMLTGYPPLEVIGKSPKIVQSGQTPEKTYQDMWNAIHSGSVWEGEFLNKKKNGGLYWVNAVMAPVLDPDGNLQSFISIQEDITNRKLAEQALENRFLEIQKLNKELQEAQTQIVDQQRTLAALAERQRLGRNLHDSVNQSIHSLMLFSETLIALLQNGDAEQAIQAAERIHESGEQALREVRLLVHEGQAVFMKDYTELIQAVDNRLKMVERRAGIQAEFSYDLAVLEYSPPEWMENIYWIILEGLNNSFKHSRASYIQVNMLGVAEQLTVEVSDNGVGFNPEQERDGGFGMKSMQQRAEILGGALSVESSPGHGVRVKFILEIPKP